MKHCPTVSNGFCLLDTRRSNMGTFTAALCRCALLLTAVFSGIPRSNGLQYITTVLGHNVTLPCVTLSNSPVRAVEWSRPDQDPLYVFFYRNKLSDTTKQHPSYQGRVELADSQLKGGNLSLLMKNVNRSDAGIYECRVNQEPAGHQKRAVISSEPINTVNLEVIESRGKAWNRQHAAGNVELWMSVMAMIYSTAY